jgi:hypothetical protein
MKRRARDIVSATSDLTRNIGDAFDKNFTSQEEKLALKNDLMSQATDLVESVQDLQAEQIRTESTGNWLQRSWRPVVMLMFALIIIYAYFIQPAFFPNSTPVNEMLDPQFWDLLRLGMGGYVVGRSAEKVVKSVSENMNISVKQKRK